MKEPISDSVMAATYPMAADWMPYCRAANPTQGCLCTRPVGHAGDHVAHDGDAWDAGVCDILAIWPATEGKADA